SAIRTIFPYTTLFRSEGARGRLGFVRWLVPFPLGRARDGLIINTQSLPFCCVPGGSNSLTPLLGKVPMTLVLPSRGLYQLAFTLSPEILPMFTLILRPLQV